MNKIKSEQSIALPSGSSPSHQNQQHPITTAVKTINLANISFKNNNKKLVKRIAFSSLGEFANDYSQSASLSDFRTEVIQNLNRVNKFSNNFNSSNSPTLSSNAVAASLQLPIATLTATNAISISKDPFSSQSITKFFQEERTASISSKADIHRKIMGIVTIFVPLL